MSEDRTSDQPDRTGRPLHNRKLEKPWIKQKLIRELALSGKTQRVLAEEYDCTQSSISEFNTRHADRINAVREDASNEFAGLWIADKAKRIEVYEDQLAGIQSMLENGASAEEIPALLKVAQAGLKAVAEEMGQLTARVAVQADVQAKVRYEIVGVNPEDLT